MSAEMPVAFGSFLRRLAGQRSTTFEQMAELAAQRFGPAAPCSAKIAAYLGRTMRGLSSLNRLGRDQEVAEWLIANQHTGRIQDIQAACTASFGADRTPSRTNIAAFLHQAGRRGRHDQSRLLGRDTEVSAWLRENGPAHTLTQLLDACQRRFGAKRTPSRTALWRFLKRHELKPRKRPLRTASDPEVAAWARANAPTKTLSELVAGCMARFGRERCPSRAALQRYLSRLPGAHLTRYKGRIDRDPEIAAWVRDHGSGMTTDALHKALIGRFGAVRAPSRSGLHRFRLASSR